MYTRDQVKAITDKLLDMAKTDAEVDFSGSERSGTRFANSTITTNLVQYDQQVTITLYQGQRAGSASTRDFSDAGLKNAVDEAVKRAASAREMPNPPVLLGPQTYLPVDAAVPGGVNFGPLERARMVKASLDVAETKGVLGAGYIPKIDQATCTANNKGLFAYYRAAEASFILTCRTPDGTGSGWAGTTGIKDPTTIDAAGLTTIAADKALRSRKAVALEPGRYTVILEPRANARFLSLMTGIFNARAAESGRSFLSKPGGATKLGEKAFSDLLTLRSDIGNTTLRQTPMLSDNKPAAPVTWVEKGVVKNLIYDEAYARQKNVAPTPANLNMSLVMEGTSQSVEDMIKSTRRGLLVTFFWYIRGVDQDTLLNTGMTRDGLFLIENGEITRPVQNFRWNMSPLVGYNNLTAVGRPVPMHMGESYDGQGTALIPPVRMEDFYMTSVSPAV
ncbi:MAG: TldD/PmbA family protein [Acidobacteriota bacterium]|nr:TldD/PmbA family protein [Acidobacteriota bacterium]